MGQLIELRRASWRDMTLVDIGKRLEFIKQCGDRVPHSLAIEQHWRKVIHDLQTKRELDDLGLDLRHFSDPPDDL